MENSNAYIPPKPPNSFRVTIELNRHESRMDNVLLTALRSQKENLNLFNLSRSKLKELFSEGKIQIKGQAARPSSALAKGTTYVDILGY